MDRSQKQQIAAALHQDLAIRFASSTHQTGPSVEEVTQLRRQMRSAGARYRVTKNRLARRAIEGTPFANLAPLFTGPTAISFSRDPVAAAKAAVEYANRNTKLTVIGGGLSGQTLDAAAVKALATLPSLDELRSKIIGCSTRRDQLAVLLQTPARSWRGSSPPTPSRAARLRAKAHSGIRADRRLGQHQGKRE